MASTTKRRSFVFLLVLSLVGSALLAVTPPADLSPNSLRFGKQLVGTTSGPSAVTLTNHLATPLTITSISVSGDFAQTNNCGTVLAPGHNCTIKVTFTPTAVGTRTGQLTVIDNADNSPQVTSLSGRGSVSGLSSISVTPVNPSIPLGLKQQFFATGFFKNGTISDLTTSLTWSSSNTAVAAISNAAGSQGLATSTGQGATTITASLGSVSGSATLTVIPPVLVSIALTPVNPSITLGKTLQFTAIGTFTDGSTQNVTTSVTWGSANTSVATISNSPGSQGLVSSLAQGTSTITGTSGPLSSSTTLTVNPPPSLVFIVVMPTSARINLGQTLQFTAIGTFTDGSTQDLTTLVRWSSQSQFPVATISSQGLATGVGEGIATIIAAGQGQQCQHHCTATATLTVIRPRLVSITLTPANPSVQVGNRLQLTAIGNFNDGSTTDLTTQTIWSSSNPNVATISNTLGSQGHVTGVAEGTTTITANSGPPLISSVILVVSSQPPGSIAVRPAFVSIPLGDAQQFTAAITLADGTAQDVTTAVNWSTSNPAVASISNALGSQGRATSLTLGTTTITATQGSASGSTTLTVVALVPGQARFAYVTNSVDFTVSLYRVDGSTGLLTPNGTTFVGDQTFPDAVAADPMGRFLYVANRQANTVSAYTIDSRAGLLTAIAGPPVFASVPFGLAAHPSGEFLFVANGPGSVSTYSIGSTGVLTFISQTAVAAGGAISVAVDPSGSFVYAANVNANTLSAYSFDSTTGILSPVPGSPFPTGPTPQSVTVDPSGKFVYAPNGNGQSVSAYTIDSTTGALTPVASSPFAVGMIPNSVAVDPTGKFAYVTNRASDTISAFTVDSTTGALQPTAGSPFSVPVNFTPVQVTVDPLGKTLYVINQLGNGISLFVIDSVSGALTSLGLVPAGLVPLSMVLTR